MASIDASTNKTRYLQSWVRIQGILKIFCCCMISLLSPRITLRRINRILKTSLRNAFLLKIPCWTSWWNERRKWLTRNEFFKSSSCSMNSKTKLKLPLNTPLTFRSDPNQLQLTNWILTFILMIALNSWRNSMRDPRNCFLSMISITIVAGLNLILKRGPKYWRNRPMIRYSVWTFQHFAVLQFYSVNLQC